MKTEHRIVLWSLLAGAAYWVLDVVVDSLVFSGLPLTRELFGVGTHHLYMRSLGAGSLVAFGLLFAAYVGRSRRALAAAEQEKNRILNSITEHVIQHDRDMRIVWANRAAAESVGLAPAQMKGRCCWELWHGADEPCEGCPVVAALATGRPAEHAIDTPDGRSWLVRGYPVRDGAGELIGAVETTLEVTARRRAEQALRQSEENFRTLAENTLDAIVILGADGSVVYANRRITEILGYDMEEVRDASVFDLLHPDDRDMVRERFHLRLSGEPVRRRYVVRGLRRDGGVRHVEVLATTTTWRGRPADLASIRDITERVQAMEALKASRDEAEWFSDRLAELHTATVELSNVKSFDALCRRAVELGRSRLGFDRLGLWFLSDEAGAVRGAYGVDVRGQVCDERAEAGRVAPDSLMGQVLAGRLRLGMADDVELLDMSGKVVGAGTLAIAPLWDAERIIGCLCADNLLKGKAITRRHGELLGLYASALGHLSSRIRVEQALRASEERFREVFERSPVGIGVFDAEGVPVDVNPAAMAILGVSSPADMADFRLFEEPDLPVEAKVQLCEGRMVRRELRYDLDEAARRGQLGTSRRGRVWLDAVLAPLGVSPTAPPRGCLVQVRDVTERRRAEDALRASEQQYRRTIDSMGDAIHVVDTDLRILLCNRGFDRWLTELGLPTDVVGRTLTEAFPFLAETVPAEYRRVLETGEVLLTQERTVLGGREIWTETRKIPVAEAGRIDRVVTVVRDISERKRADAELRRERDFATSLVDTARVIVLVLDPAGRIVRFNRFAEELTGYEEAAVLGKSWFDVFVRGEDDEAVRAVFDRVLAGETAHGLENAVVAADGREVLVRWHNSLLRDARGRGVGVLAVGNDMTEIRRKEAQLHQAAKMEAIGRLAGGIAHDFNNMLAVIEGYADLLGRSLAGDERLADVEKVQDAARRAAALTGQLLAFGRKQITQPEPLSLNASVASMQSMLARTLGEDVRLETSCAADLWPVMADPARVEEILLNLTINARDAMPMGGTLTIATENVRVGPGGRSGQPPLPAGDHVLLSVADTGVGMSEEVKARIFEPFFSTKETGQGTGLGLATCYGIVTQAAGQIVVDSAPGKGARFRVYLPRAAGGRAPAEAAPAAADAAGLPAGSETVLVVEDEENVRRLVVRVLRECGYTVLEAAGAREAVPLGEHYEGRIDLLITDVVMPEVGGVELADRLGGVRPRMKVLYVTGYSEAPPAAAGAEVLAKPFAPSRLAEAVRRTLDARRRRGRAAADRRRRGGRH